MEMLLNLLHDSRNTARIVETLGRPLPGRAHIEKISCVSVQSVKGVTRDFNSKLMCKCRNVKETVGASRYRGMDKNSIFKALIGNYVARLHIL